MPESCPDITNQDRDTSMKLCHDTSMQASQLDRMTTYVTNGETSFIRQSKDKTHVVGIMNNVETEPGQGFTIKANVIRQGAISSTHLHPTAIAWREDNVATSNDLGISNETKNEANGRLKLVQSSYNEET